MADWRRPDASCLINGTVRATGCRPHPILDHAVPDQLEPPRAASNLERVKLPLIPKERKYRGHRCWSGSCHELPLTQKSLSLRSDNKKQKATRALHRMAFARLSP